MYFVRFGNVPLFEGEYCSSEFKVQCIRYLAMFIRYIHHWTVDMGHLAVAISAHEMSLSAGLQYERDLFFSTFATEDREIGMEAFVHKKTPSFTGK